jgi:hypothetical protein
LTLDAPQRLREEWATIVDGNDRGDFGLMG